MRSPWNRRIIALLKAGMSSGLQLVTTPRSTTTSSSTQSAPAFSRSFSRVGHDGCGSGVEVGLQGFVSCDEGRIDHDRAALGPAADDEDGGDLPRPGVL